MNARNAEKGAEEARELTRKYAHHIDRMKTCLSLSVPLDSPVTSRLTTCQLRTEIAIQH